MYSLLNVKFSVPYIACFMRHVSRQGSVEEIILITRTDGNNDGRLSGQGCTTVFVRKEIGKIQTKLKKTKNQITFPFLFQFFHCSVVANIKFTNLNYSSPFID